MSTSFPGAIQQFPTMQDVLASDGALLAQYQQAIQSGNISLAKSILLSIPNGENKIITADLMNTIADTMVALQKYYTESYSPGYVVSATQPAGQSKGDYWFQVTG